jgi:hypothetical protein
LRDCRKALENRAGHPVSCGMRATVAERPLRRIAQTG